MKQFLIVVCLVVSTAPSVLAEQFSVSSTAGPVTSNPCVDYTRYICLKDEFFGGAAVTGMIGAMGWNSNGGSTAQGGGVANEPGFYLLSTGTTINTTESIYTQGSSSVIAAGSWDLAFRVRGDSKDGNTTMQVGLQDNVISVSPTNGSYFQALDGDTNWFCVTRSGGVQTRTDSGVAVSTSAFQMLRQVRTGNDSVTFSINGATVCSHTTNLHSVNTNTTVAIKNSAASNKNMAVGFFNLVIPVTR